MGVPSLPGAFPNLPGVCPAPVPSLSRACPERGRGAQSWGAVEGRSRGVQYRGPVAGANGRAELAEGSAASRLLTSMDVLLVGSDNPLGVALRGVLAQWGRHSAAGLTVAGSRWRSARQAKKAVRKGRSDAVVDCRLAWQIAAGDVPTAADIERGHWLAKACERSGMRYILLSCDRVFSGLTLRRLRESDPADASAAPGVQMLELESRVAQSAPSALVLRTGPLFASVGRNLLTQTLERMDLAATRLSRPKTDGLSPPKTEPGRAAEFDNRDVFCPVCSVDAARVIAAILDQLSVGARACGIYHYGSCDRATAYDFAEAALAAARPWLNSACRPYAARAPEPAQACPDPALILPGACPEPVLSLPEACPEPVPSSVAGLSRGAQSRGAVAGANGGAARLSSPKTELAEVSPKAETRVLDCSRLRSTFAVKQVSWRHFVHAVVQQYYRAVQCSMNSAAGRLG